MKDRAGVTPLIYMSKSVCRQFDWKDTAELYPLWVAQYRNKNITGWQKEPWTDAKGYGAWSKPAIFQYTSTGRLEGYRGNLDLDIAYISKGTWNNYASPSSDLEKVAQEVIDGLWGNGADRRKRLTEAGYDYKAVQAVVNSMLKK